MVISPAQSNDDADDVADGPGPQVIHCGVNEPAAEEYRLRPVHQPL